METRRTFETAAPKAVTMPDGDRTRRPTGTTSVRVAALGGVIFFALVIAFASLTSGMPAATEARQEIFDYVAGHDGRLQLAAALLGLAMPAALLLLSGLFRALRTSEGGIAGVSLVAFGGGVLTATATATGALILGTTANRIADLGPGDARVWWTMYLLSFGGALLGFLALIGATAAVSLQRRLFPRWFGIASVILALVSLVGAFTIGYLTTWIQVVAGVAIVLDSVWILLVSIYLLRDPEVALA